jgi:hypothetical protein
MSMIAESTWGLPDLKTQFATKSGYRHCQQAAVVELSTTRLLDTMPCFRLDANRRVAYRIHTIGEAVAALGLIPIPAEPRDVTEWQSSIVRASQILPTGLIKLGIRRCFQLIKVAATTVLLHIFLLGGHGWSK